jgi:Glycosyltransferase 61
VYFNDSTPFAEQFELFYHTDILISPHGAQLTGLPFMPPTCGTVLEVMPRGYYLPHFFGSLARAANLKHGTVSLTESGDSRQESIDGMRHMAARSHYRKQQLCPDTNGIVDAVLQLVDEWQQCVTTASTIATQ